jgi:CheY-like chemotaxis protein/predicted transcriptional regulator
MGLAMTREKPLGSFSFDVVRRILNVLSEHGRTMKKTNLASKAGLNYNVCLRYVHMLNSLGWIEVSPEVSITGEGKTVSAKLLDVYESGASNFGVHHDDDVWPNNLWEESIKHPSPSDTLSSTTAITDTKSSPSSEIDETQSFSESKQKIGNRKKKTTIMIVDDDKDIARIYQYFLSSVGYEVRTFIDARSALSEYVADPFLYDLLILDIRMQGINGLQLYQSIKAINPECKAIFVSGLDSAREAVRILPGTRPQNTLQKPVSKQQFVTAVKTALVQ